jgi:hypothetical protein
MEAISAADYGVRSMGKERLDLTPLEMLKESLWLNLIDNAHQCIGVDIDKQFWEIEMRKHPTKEKTIQINVRFYDGPRKP